MKNKFAYLLLTLLFLQAVYAVDNITVKGLFRDKAIVDIDGKQRVLIANKPSPEGVVLISSDSNKAVLEVDGVRNTFSLGTDISNKFKKASPQKTVTIAPDANGMYWVNGSINDYQVKFVVDTGATLISMNKHEAQRFGIDFKMDGEISYANTASGIDKIYVVKLKKVKVGDIELRGITGAVHNSDFPKAILLGNSFLGKLDMSREGRILQLHKK